MIMHNDVGIVGQGMHVLCHQRVERVEGRDDQQERHEGEDE